MTRHLKYASLGVPGLVLALLCTALVAVAPSAGAAAPLPARLKHIGDSRQVIVVHSPSWQSSHATLRAWQKGRDGTWRRRFGPMPARVGYDGFAPARHRRQNSGTTPAGTFRIGRAFGTLADPGTALRYTRADRNDWWVYDPRSPRTYNLYQPYRSARAGWRRAWAERIFDYGRQYRYAAVVRYNMPRQVHWGRWMRQYVAEEPADTRRGGGIFLHVSGSGPTAGCVSVGPLRMRRLLRWLDPRMTPRIVMGPGSAITRL